MGKAEAQANVRAIARTWARAAGYVIEDDGRVFKKGQQPIEYPA